MIFERYNPKLKVLAKKLRNNGTKAEIALWNHLKRKQLLGLDFHRQKPLGDYIADFYCPAVRLAIEIDGRSHLHEESILKDRKKESYLFDHKIMLLRVRNDEVFNDIAGVLKKIEDAVESNTGNINTPPVPLLRGDKA